MRLFSKVCVHTEPSAVINKYGIQIVAPNPNPVNMRAQNDLGAFALLKKTESVKGNVGE
jgi:hypothetical protein